MPSPIDGEMMYCFPSGDYDYFIKDLPNITASQEQLEKVIEKKIIETDPIGALTENTPFNGLIDSVDIVLISTDVNDSSNIKYYVLGRVENVDGTFKISCSPWITTQLSGRVPVFQPEQKYNTGDIVRYQETYFKCVLDNLTPSMTTEEKMVRLLDENVFVEIPIKGASYTFTGGAGLYQTDEENGTDVLSLVDMETLNLSKCRIVLRFFDVYGKHISVMNNTPDIETLNIGYFVEVVR